MKLSLRNIGKIKEASIEIEGITVIAGENDTGKSTASRALFFAINSFRDISRQVQAEQEESLFDTLLPLRIDTQSYISYAASEHYAQDILSEKERYKNDSSLLRASLVEILKKEAGDFPSEKGWIIDAVVEDITERLNISTDDIFKTVLRKKLMEEFNGQAVNIYTQKGGSIELETREGTVAVEVREENRIALNAYTDLHIEAFYIDDPGILDNIPFTTLEERVSSHQEHLQAGLRRARKAGSVVEEIIAEKKLQRIDTLISSVCGGELVQLNQYDIGYKERSGDQVLNIKNLSAGLKTFAILKMLLLNGALKKGGTVILDEPEIHLHPEWQLLFAEIIVLLHKEFQMHILLNTHSPYFLNAIEVYSKKYGVDGKCRYYLASLSEGFSTIEDVTENTEAIYQKLSRPFQTLENEESRNDGND